MSEPAPEPIATQMLCVRCNDGEKPIVIHLYAPKQQEADWQCEPFIAGFGREVRRHAFGVDAMQALVLAIHILPTEVRKFANEEGAEFIEEPDFGIDRACWMNLENRWEKS